jgi:hypothetical protein
LGEVFVAGDADGDLLQRSQGVDDLLDAHPGGVLQVAGDGQRGEHDGQVGLDRVAGVVEDRAGARFLPDARSNRIPRGRRMVQ